MGAVFRDIDRDGVKDESEPGVPGVRVYLDRDGDGVFDAGEPSRMTSESGSYEFFTLANGQYQVRIVVPELLEQIMPLAGTGQTRSVNDAVVEASFSLGEPLATIDPEPPQPRIDPRVIPSLSESRPVRPIQLPSQTQTLPPPFIGAGGGEVSPAQGTSSDRSVASRQPWLQAIEVEVDDLLPALAEVFSSGIFEPDSGDPPPPLRRVTNKPVTQTKDDPVDVASIPSGDPSSDGWSLWWWSLAPVTAAAGGLWWRYGPAVPWRSGAHPIGRRANTRLK